MFRREMRSKRGSLPPNEGDLTCMKLVNLTKTNSWYKFGECSTSKQGTLI